MLSQLPRTVEEIEALLNGTRIYPQSLQHAGGEVMCFAKDGHQHYLLCVFNPQAPSFLRDHLSGEVQDVSDELAIKWAWPGHSNAKKLRALLTWTAPTTLSTNPALPIRDFIGLAAPAILRAHAAQEYNFVLVFEAAPDELTALSRTADESLDAVTFAAFAENYRRPWGMRGADLPDAEAQERYQALGYTEFSFAGDNSAFNAPESEAWQRAALQVVAQRAPDLLRELEATGASFLDVWTAKNENGSWRFRDRIYRLLLDNEELHFELVRATAEPIFLNFHNNPLRNE